MKPFALILFLVVLWPTPMLGPTGAQAVSDRQDPTSTIDEDPAKHHILKDFEPYLARVKPLLERYGYAAVFVAVTVEGCGIPAPGQTLLMAGSLAAANQEMHILPLLLVAVLAAILGNTAGFLMGRWGARAILTRFKGNEERMARVENRFRRYGGMLILVARFLDGPRQLNGIVAGILDMPWWYFTLYNVSGALLWTLFWGLGLYYLDENIYLFYRILEHLGIWVPILAMTSFLLLIAYLLRRRSKANRNIP